MPQIPEILARYFRNPQGSLYKGCKVQLLSEKTPYTDTASFVAMEPDRLLLQMKEAVKRARKARQLSESQRRSAQKLVVKSEQLMNRTTERLKRWQLPVETKHRRRGGATGARTSSRPGGMARQSFGPPGQARLAK